MGETEDITDAEIDAVLLLGVVPEELALSAVMELRRRRALEKKWLGEDQVKRLLAPQRLRPTGERQSIVDPTGSYVGIVAYEEALSELLPYREELLKIAEQLGEGTDPFSVWESIAHD